MSPAGSPNTPPEMAVIPRGNDVGFLIVRSVRSVPDILRGRSGTTRASSNSDTRGVINPTG